jgi:hypothetical protein
MPAKTLKEQFTNVLLVLSMAFGGTLGTLILSNQDTMQKDITAIKVSIGVDKTKIEDIEQRNDKQDNRLDKIQGVTANQKLFKHEDFFILNNY